MTEKVRNVPAFVKAYTKHNKHVMNRRPYHDNKKKEQVWQNPLLAQKLAEAAGA